MSLGKVMRAEIKTRGWVVKGDEGTFIFDIRGPLLMFLSTYFQFSLLILKCDDEQDDIINADNAKVFINNHCPNCL
jgi:hypothetical protein